MSLPTSPTRPREGQNLFSQVPGNPTFRDQSLNAIALVPLLSSAPSDDPESWSASCRSHRLLMQSLERYANDQVASGTKLPKDIETDSDDDDELSEVSVGEGGDEGAASSSSNSPKKTITEVLLVVPNAQLTRPGDWRYEKTPLQNFHWGHGCQRLVCFDGRPHDSRRAHDRLMNTAVSRDWIDLVPSRRTAAVVGVLNLKDIEGVPDGLKRAETELQQWAERYSTPSYEVTAHGRSFARDGVVQRLFVFDSEEVDLSSTRLGSNLVAFPDVKHTHMMDLHLNVVVNDLAVAVFRQLEIRIRESDLLSKEKSGWKGFGGSSSPSPPVASRSTRHLTRGPLPSDGVGGTISNMAQSAARAMRRNPGSAPPQLLTPLDTVWDLNEVSPKDADAMRRRDVGRREKMAADLCLLAGSPMDAYERYSKAAEMAKASPDPLWYAVALEGCAAAHISMAEAGGYNVDSYLDNNFQLPDEFMAMSQNGPIDMKKAGSTKQTLPAVIFALCEEALHIFNRHESLSNFHAELLLKLAAYTAVMHESHMRCRWGEGVGCYGGDPGEPRRWDKTAVARLTFSNTMTTRDGEDLIRVSTFRRTQRFCEFLHRACSTGALDSLTRADVSAASARLCLTGLQSTRWKFHDGSMLKLPRKAAFLTTIAAEALSKYTARESDDYKGGSLWLASVQLLGKDSNSSDEDSKPYGWAALRACCLHALSQQEDPITNEAAAELLLILLSEMSTKTGDLILLEKRLKEEDNFAAKAAQFTLMDDDTESVTSVGTSMTTRMTLSSKYGSKAGTTTRSGFFSQTNQASLLTVAQAKWAEDTPIAPTKLPLVEELSEFSLANSVVALRAVLPKINIATCAIAQKRCINQISEMRKGAPTLSTMDESVNPLAAYYSGSMAPLHIESVKVVKSDTHLLLERNKAHGFSGKATGAMATFFNPFENKKKQAAKKIEATLVAEGEEREVEIEIDNRLSVPLEVPSCMLVFDKDESDLIKAPGLSFTVPPKAKKYKVRFPFIVVANKDGEGQPAPVPAPVEPEPAGDTDDEDDDDDAAESAEPAPTPGMFEVIGIQLTCLSRSFFIPVARATDSEPDLLVPTSASIYTKSAHNLPNNKKNKKQEEAKPRFEAVPAQPNLMVSFQETHAAIDDGTTVPVHLSDGEIFTIPSFRLQNDFGPSGKGVMQRLQIVGVGMPGLPDEVLFDTDAEAAAREEEDDSEEEDEFEELMEEDGLPPLKMKALCESLSLKSINDRLGAGTEGSRVTFQVAATHDMGTSLLANGGNVRIRFRYRGLSPNPASEIWRKREIMLRIVRVKGPRISSLTFRSDLSWGSSYSELCLALAQQKTRSEMVAKKWGSRDSFRMSGKDAAHLMSSAAGTLNENGNEDDGIFHRVGLDAGVHVASDEIVVLMAVANETNSTITLSNRKGRVGGFSGSPMPTVRVTSGVSVKIPVVIPRIDRLSKEGMNDICAELVSSTALQWESIVDDSSVVRDSNLKKRQGRVRIPSKCLKEIMSEHSSFAARICQSPVTVKVELIGPPSGTKTKDALQVKKGQPVEAHVHVEWHDWVPKAVREQCSVIMEFCAARKNAAGTLRREYVWCGMLRRVATSAEGAAAMSHTARVMFLTEGNFVVSGCAKIKSARGRGGVEETWWAPMAEPVVVA